MDEQTDARIREALTRLDLGDGWQGFTGEDLGIPRDALPAEWTEVSVPEEAEVKVEPPADDQPPDHRRRE